MRLPSLATNEKRFISFIVLVLLLFWILVAGFIWFRRVKTVSLVPSPGKVSTVSPQPVKPQLSYSRVIDDLLANIGARYHSQSGLYTYLSNYEDHCRIEDGEEICLYNNQNIFHTANAWTALAYLAVSQTDPTKLSFANRDAARLLEICQEKGLSSCLWVLWQIEKLYQATNDKLYADFLERSYQLLSTREEIYPNDVMLLSIEARQLLAGYRRNKNEFYRRRGMVKLDKVLKLMFDPSQKESIATRFDDAGRVATAVHEHECWVDLARLESVRSGGDVGVLVELTEKYLGRDSVFLPERIFNFHFISPSNWQPCVEVILLLEQQNSDEEVKQELRKNAQEIIDGFLVEFWQPTKLTDDGQIETGGILLSDKASQERSSAITDVAYMVYLLQLFLSSDQ